MIINKILAYEELGNIGGEGLGPFGNLGTGNTSQGTALRYLTNVISAVIGVMTVAAAIWFIFQVLVAGMNWITAAGDKGKLETARNRLRDGIIGLLIVVFGWGLLALVGQFLGFETIFISNPNTFFNNFNLLR